MSEDSPKVVGLDTSIELSEFPSETELTSEAEFASEAPAMPAPMVAAVPPAPPSNVLTLSTPEPRLRPEDQPARQPETSATPVAQVAAATAQGPEIEPADVVDPVRPPHAGPALIAEFPVKAQTPAAVALPTLPPGPMSLVDLIERRGGFDWREAVAVIQQICVYLRDHSPQTPIHLDPRTIQITERGEVRLLSGQTSSDP